MKITRMYLKEAGFIATQQQDAILKLCLLTGLAEQINQIIEYIRKSKDEKSKDKEFKGDFLKELRDKNPHQISNYIESCPLKAIFNFVGDTMTQEEFNEVLVGFTQINWFGRSGERWNGVDIMQKLKSFDKFEEIKRELNQTGVLNTDQSQPVSGNPVAILGSTVQTMKNRLEYSIGLKVDGEKHYFLVGNRFLNEEEKTTSKLLESVQTICSKKGLPRPETIEELTETHGAMFIADEINKKRISSGLLEIDFRFVDTPAYLNFENPAVLRPNTEATIRQFLIDTLDDGIDINNVTFISNAANVEAQKVAIERVLAENNFTSHTAIVKGECCVVDTEFSAVSGTMAGRLFGVLPRVEYGTGIKLESKSKESFRDSILSYTQGNLKSVIRK